MTRREPADGNGSEVVPSSLELSRGVSESHRNEIGCGAFHLKASVASPAKGPRGSRECGLPSADVGLGARLFGGSRLCLDRLGLLGSTADVRGGH